MPQRLIDLTSKLRGKEKTTHFPTGVEHDRLASYILFILKILKNIIFLY